MAIQDFNLASLDGSNGFRLDGVNKNDFSGRSVSDAGDVNGDGFADLIIGAASAGLEGNEQSGSSYVLFGKASGFDAQMNLSTLDGSNGFRLDGEHPLDHSGTSVSSAGDVNGDGFDDLIVGSPYAGSNGDSSGSSYVLFGKASGFDAQMNLSTLDGSNGFRMDGEHDFDQLGMSVSSAGDVNGDGFDDVIVDAPGADSNGPNSGASYVVLGKASGFAAQIDLSKLDGSNGFRLDGENEYDFLGYSVSDAGDVNGDGFDDVIIGTSHSDTNGQDSGSSYVVFGKASGFDEQMDISSLDGSNGFRMDGEAGDASGWSVSSAGDVNGDGFADVIVGVPFTSPNGPLSGASYVVFGKASGFDAQFDLSSLDGQDGFRLVGDYSYGHSGFSVSNAGDVNGDGLDDLIVGAPFFGTYLEGSGASYVVFGRSSGFGAQMDLSSLDGLNGFRVNGENLRDESGISVSGAGDINNDGFDDLIVGSGKTGDDSAGSSYVIFGSPDVTGNLALIAIGGTAATDDLHGSAAAEYLSAGAGDDTLAGGGGSDKFDGGEGDDVIGVADLGFAAVDGGTGNDTLRLAGSGMNLDLTQLADKIHHVETIDLQGTGDNSLVLNAESIPNFNESLSATSKSLTIQGDQGDRVRVLDVNWTDQGIADGYHSYVSSLGTLRVQDDVQVDFQTGISNSFNVADLDGSNGFHLDGENIDDHFGASVSDAGDVNGDGFDDVIVSAPRADSSYVVFGRASRFDVSFDVSDLDGSNGFRLDGSSSQVSGAGDVNGDGFADVIIGSNYTYPNGTYSGASYVVFGRASGFDATMVLSGLDGSNGFRLMGANDESDSEVSGAGDINNDGFGDVIVSSDSNSYVVFGRASGFGIGLDLASLDGNNGFRMEGPGRISSAGDVNDDGFDDVIVGHPGDDSNGENSGSSYVIFGKASGFGAQMDLSSLDGSNGFRLDGEHANDFSGISVSNAGDINGDGFGDVIVGAVGGDTGGEQSGSSYVVFGKASGFDAAIDLSTLDGSNGFRLDGEHTFDYSGVSVSSAGDVNGDGYDDLVIGSSAVYSFSHSYVVFGKASGFDAQINLGNMPSEEGIRLDVDNPVVFGASISGAGDINGDGLDDLIVGAPDGIFHSDYYTTGKSYVIFGSRDFGSGGGGGGELPEIKGTDDNDTLKGSEIAEHFIAGDGNDNLLARGGADVFDAGAGDDAIRIGDLTFASIDGGDGNDALHLAGADLSLDLTVLGDRIHSIETICLYGRGDNTLTLNADSLLSLSDSTNTLKVHGNSGDHITMQDSGWVDGGGSGFYHTYTHDDAVLLVGANVTVELV